jgi:lipopolysaccharide export LptBFGC system permease protein LptF
MKEKEAEFIDVIKKITRNYFFAFVFVFMCLFINQFLLVRDVIAENQLNISQKIMMMLYLIPPIIVMCAPFTVCIGFAQGLVEIKIFEKITKTSKEIFIKKIVVPVLGFSIIISALTFIVSDYVLPNANVSFDNLYRPALIKNDREQPVISFENSPRNMSSKMIILGIKKIQVEKEDNFEKKINTWKLELNKKFSIPLGALFMSLFAMSLSLIIKDHKKIGFLICLFSCILYWALLVYGQIFSTNSGKYGALAMWLPNILFLCISCVLYLCYRKINKPPASVRAATQKGFNVA